MESRSAPTEAPSTSWQPEAGREIVTIAYNAAPPQEPGDPEPGEELWLATFGPANPGRPHQNLQAVAEGIVVTPDGATVLVVGAETIGQNSDYLTIAYKAATGEQQWLSRYGTGKDDHALAIALSPDGKLAYVTGKLSRPDTGHSQTGTVAYTVGGDAGGEVQWAAHDPFLVSGAYQLTVSKNGARVFVAGYRGVASMFTTRAYDAASGDELWAAHYTAGPGLHFPASIAVSPKDDLVFVSGTVPNPNCRGFLFTYNCDIVVLAYDQATGLERWSHIYGFPVDNVARDWEKAPSVAASPDGSRVYVTGTSGTSGIAGGGADQLTLAFDSRSGEQIAVGRYNPSGVDDLLGQNAVPSPDGSRVYTVGTIRRADGTTASEWLISCYPAPGGKPEPTPCPTSSPSPTPTSTPSESPSSSPSPAPTSTPSESPSPTPTPTDNPGERGTYPTTPDDPFFGPGEPIDPLGIDDPLDTVWIGTQWGPQKISANLAWQETRATGHGIHVAVLDSGVDLDHPDLACSGKLEVVSGSDVVANNSDPDDQHGHGTHVAGIIGACTNNETGIAGVAPDATIVPIRVLNANGSGTDAQLIAGINRAVEAGADVINMSLSYPPGKEIINDVTAIDAALEAAAAQGVVIVAAAGNDSFPLCEYPSLAEDVICVGATDSRDNKAWYSTFANKTRGGPAVVAPGGSEPVFCDIHSENILSLYPPAKDRCDEGLAGYRGLNGTSMAAPHVAGVAALVYDRLGGARSPENAQKVIDALTSTAVDLGTPGSDPVYGSGRIDALAAVQSIPAGDPDPTPTPTETTTGSPSPSDTGSPSPTPSDSPALDTTEVSFTGDSAPSGQYSDETLFEARLTDSNGDPLAGRELTFELVGDGSRTFNATTNGDGVAAVTPRLEEKPGPYQLTVRFAGDDEHAGDADTASFVVEREDSALDLTEEKGKDKALVAHLYDADTPADGIAGRTIDFYAGAELIGSATTDDDGVATFEPPKQKGKKKAYEAVFEGDDFYLGSSDNEGKGGNGGNGGGSDNGGRDASTGYGGKVLLM